MMLCDGLTLLVSLWFSVSRDQLVAEPHRRLLTLFFVAGANGLSFVVGHQGQIDSRWQAALGKFHWSSRVDERRVISQQRCEIV